MPPCVCGGLSLSSLVHGAGGAEVSSDEAGGLLLRDSPSITDPEPGLRSHEGPGLGRGLRMQRDEGDPSAGGGCLYPRATGSICGCVTPRPNQLRPFNNQ